MDTVFTGRLRYLSPRCECFGCNSSSVMHTKIARFNYFRIRYYCKQGHQTFSAKAIMSQKNAILIKLLNGRSLLDSFFEEPRLKSNYLPKHLLIGEFKGTKDCQGVMCFILSDADTGMIFDILEDRRSFKLFTYFMCFTYHARKNVSYAVMDMNASYDSVTKVFLLNARISFDRFHVIQQVNRAFNKQRITTMNHLKNSDPKAMKNYRKLKKYWCTFLKKNGKLNYSAFKQFLLFQRKYLSESEVLDYLLSIDDHLRQSYDVYQELLTAFDNKDFTAFYDLIDILPASLDYGFKKAILYLNKHKKAIINAFKYPYSHGKLEGKNNLIKVIKRIAFGFRTFRHLRMRIMIQQNLCDII